MPVAERLDLSGLTCPMTWVRTKLALERLAPGAVLEVRLGNPESLHDVPRSAAAAGHAVWVDGELVRITNRGAEAAPRAPRPC